MLKSLSDRTPAVWAERNFVIRIGVSVVSIVSPFAQRGNKARGHPVYSEPQRLLPVALIDLFGPGHQAIREAHTDELTAILPPERHRI